LFALSAALEGGFLERPVLARRDVLASAVAATTVQTRYPA
jgi:hypothetical protein